MKNFLLVTVTFILSFFVVGWLFTLTGSLAYEASSQSGSSLQSAVTFGGINFLALFIYILIAIIITTIIFFNVKNRRSN